jgi:hypothetical protein
LLALEVSVICIEFFCSYLGIHASLKDEGWTLEQLKQLQCPIILLQAANDKVCNFITHFGLNSFVNSQAVEPLKLVLDEGKFAGKYVLRTYFDQVCFSHSLRLPILISRLMALLVLEAIAVKH